MKMKLLALTWLAAMFTAVGNQSSMASPQDPSDGPALKPLTVAGNALQATPSSVVRANDLKVENDLLIFDVLQTPTADQFNIGYEGWVPSGYHGLIWNNFSVIHPFPYMPSGYNAGIISPYQEAFSDGTEAFITSAYPFNLISAYMTAAWNDNLQVRVNGLS